jgi:hypothetical protein
MQVVQPNKPDDGREARTRVAPTHQVELPAELAAGGGASAPVVQEKHKRKLLIAFLDNQFPADDSNPRMKSRYQAVQDEAFTMARRQGLNSEIFRRHMNEIVQGLRSYNPPAKVAQYQAAASMLCSEEQAYEDRRCSRNIFNTIGRLNLFPEERKGDFERRLGREERGSPMEERQMLHELFDIAFGPMRMVRTDFFRLVEADIDKGGAQIERSFTAGIKESIRERVDEYNRMQKAMLAEGAIRRLDLSHVIVSWYGIAVANADGTKTNSMNRGGIRDGRPEKHEAQKVGTAVPILEDRVAGTFVTGALDKIGREVAAERLMVGKPDEHGGNIHVSLREAGKGEYDCIELTIYKKEYDPLRSRYKWLPRLEP